MCGIYRGLNVVTLKHSTLFWKHYKKVFDYFSIAKFVWCDCPFVFWGSCCNVYRGNVWLRPGIVVVQFIVGDRSVVTISRQSTLFGIMEKKPSLIIFSIGKLSISNPSEGKKVKSFLVSRRNLGTLGVDLKNEPSHFIFPENCYEKI